MDRSQNSNKLAVPYFLYAPNSCMEKKLEMAFRSYHRCSCFKICLSIAFSGEAGMSILKPALLGLVVCIGGLGYFFKKHKRAGKKQKISK